MHRIVIYRADDDRWFVYRGRFSHAEEAEAHGKKILRYQPAWDFKVVLGDDAAYAISVLLNK